MLSVCDVGQTKCLESIKYSNEAASKCPSVVLTKTVFYAEIELPSHIRPFQIYSAPLTLLLLETGKGNSFLLIICFKKVWLIS